MSVVVNTIDGRLFDMETIDWSKISIEDIAHTLALINRWGGRSKVPYNVAQHSLDVEELAFEAGAPPGLRYEALMHDVTEAFVGDVVGPLKRRCSDFERYEALVRDQVAQHFGLARRVPGLVHVWDKAAMGAERLFLDQRDPPELPWRESRDQFLAIYYTLRTLLGEP